jgi:hypothetical protein
MARAKPVSGEPIAQTRSGALGSRPAGLPAGEPRRGVKPPAPVSIFATARVSNFDTIAALEPLHHKAISARGGSSTQARHGHCRWSREQAAALAKSGGDALFSRKLGVHARAKTRAEDRPRAPRGGAADPIAQEPRAGEGADDVA